MKKFRKPLRFYLTLFILSSLVIAAYTIYRIVADDIGISELYTLWFLPLFFIVIYYGSDFLLDKIFNRKKKVDYEGKFLNSIGEEMRKSNEFLIEDYRRLQINYKFQESLKMAYKIYIDGEDEVFNIEKLERKFNKGTVEYRAMSYVINYIKENDVIDGKKDKNTV
ncbi:hypothetical protein KHQ88_07350 [Mycoplasmatota bacterium]|nr:hypothetical protein KHQ88_07350 [Mycoplasmatota bacterium]